MENCEDFIQEFITAIYNVFGHTFKQKCSGYTSKCIIDELKSKHFAEDAMFTEVYKASPTLTTSEKKSKTDAAEKKATATFHETLFMCESRNNIGNYKTLSTGCVIFFCSIQILKSLVWLK